MSTAIRLSAIALLALLLGGCPSRPDPPSTATTASSQRASTAEATTAAKPTTSAPKPSSSPSTLGVLTYNVLASPIFPKLRRDAVVALLDEADADIVALQEVPSWMIDALTSPAGNLARYRHTTTDGAPFFPGGQLILARHPIRDIKAATLPGEQRRTVLVATVDVAGLPVTVATSHMESFLEDGPVRAQQLDAIFAMIAGAEHAIFLGDFNFGDGEQPETGHLDPAYVDVWRALKGDDPGFTWNNDDNPMARIGAFAGEPNRRLDRILLRSTRLKAKGIRIIGNESAGERVLAIRERMMIQPIERVPSNPGEPTIAVFPSDHYGLLAELGELTPPASQPTPKP